MLCACVSPRSSTLTRQAQVQAPTPECAAACSLQPLLRAAWCACRQHSTAPWAQVSFNGGAHWESLKTPQNYTHAQCKTCDAESEPWSCQLHLHGPSSWAAGEGVRRLHTLPACIVSRHHFLTFSTTVHQAARLPAAPAWTQLGRWQGRDPAAACPRLAMPSGAALRAAPTARPCLGVHSNELSSSCMARHPPPSPLLCAGKLPQLHTHWSAPGTVMAVGNVGEYLSFARDFTCTFLSRDGGETWQDIDPRAMVFEFGDSVRASLRASWPRASRQLRAACTCQPPSAAACRQAVDCWLQNICACLTPNQATQGR